MGIFVRIGPEIIDLLTKSEENYVSRGQSRPRAKNRRAKMKMKMKEEMKQQEKKLAKPSFEQRYPKTKMSGGVLLHRCFGRDGQIIYVSIPD